VRVLRIGGISKDVIRSSPDSTAYQSASLNQPGENLTRLVSCYGYDLAKRDARDAAGAERDVECDLADQALTTLMTFQSPTRDAT
jgi:hypothetical protein